MTATLYNFNTQKIYQMFERNVGIYHHDAPTFQTNAWKTLLNPKNAKNKYYAVLVEVLKRSLDPKEWDYLTVKLLHYEDSLPCVRDSCEPSGARKTRNHNYTYWDSDITCTVSSKDNEYTTIPEFVTRIEGIEAPFGKRCEYKPQPGSKKSGYFPAKRSVDDRLYTPSKDLPVPKPLPGSGSSDDE